MTEDTPSYKPGDMVNGHILTSDNRWIPLSAAGTGPGMSPAYSHPQTGAQPVVIMQSDSNNTSLAPVTSLVSGLIGLIFGWIPIIGIIGWIFGPLALIFGFLGLGRGKAEHKIMSWIGIVCGAITLVICFVYAAAFVNAFSGSSS